MKKLEVEKTYCWLLCFLKHYIKRNWNELRTAKILKSKKYAPNNHTEKPLNFPVTIPRYSCSTL